VAAVIYLTTTPVTLLNYHLRQQGITPLVGHDASCLEWGNFLEPVVVIWEGPPTIDHVTQVDGNTAYLVFDKIPAAWAARGTSYEVDPDQYQAILNKVGGVLTQQGRLNLWRAYHMAPRRLGAELLILSLLYKETGKPADWVGPSTRSNRVRLGRGARHILNLDSEVYVALMSNSRTDSIGVAIERVAACVRAGGPRSTWLALALEEWIARVGPTPSEDDLAFLDTLLN
jgi:hypothetical protein